MPYLTAKAIHLIAAVSWFAGLFYGVRLFVYHAEAEANDEGEKMLAQFELMARRLWSGIATPAMVVTLISGVWLLYQYGRFSQVWVHFKLAQLVLLILYHGLCLKILRKQRLRTSLWTGRGLRFLNEVPTLLLVGIIVTAVFKSMMTPTRIGIILAVLGGALGLAIWGYERARAQRS